MSKFLKLSMVLAGYVAAFVVACAAAYARQLLTQDADPQSSSGMSAFGDFLLFVAVFGALSVVPTALGLYFLRPYTKCWAVDSLAALTVAVAVAVVIATIVMKKLEPNQEMSAILSFGQIIGAPLLVLGFLTGAAIAPSRLSRRALLAAASLEAAVSAYAFLCIFVLGRWV